MKQLVTLLLLTMILIMMGCTKQIAEPQKQTETVSEAPGTDANPPPAAQAQTVVAEAKSAEWAVNRLLEISNHYFEQLEEAQTYDLPYEDFRKNLRSHMTDRFMDLEQLEEFYKIRTGLTAMYLFYYEPGALEARTKILEQTSDRIVVQNMGFANELNSGYYEISTLINSEGKWLLDERRREEISKEGFQLSIEEATTYMKQFPRFENPVTSVQYVGTKTMENTPGEFGRFYQFDCGGTTYYISPVDGYVMKAI